MKATPNQIKLAKEISDYILSMVEDMDSSTKYSWEKYIKHSIDLADQYYTPNPKLSLKDDPHYALTQGLKETFDWAITSIRRVK
jgi:hypothetical protein